MTVGVPLGCLNDKLAKFVFVHSRILLRCALLAWISLVYYLG